MMVRGGRVLRYQRHWGQRWVIAGRMRKRRAGTAKTHAARRRASERSGGAIGSLPSGSAPGGRGVASPAALAAPRRWAQRIRNGKLRQQNAAKSAATRNVDCSGFGSRRPSESTYTSRPRKSSLSGERCTPHLRTRHAGATHTLVWHQTTHPITKMKTAEIGQNRS